MPIRKPAFGRKGLCVAGGSPEPTVSAECLIEAIRPSDVELLRPLLPVGYEAGVSAYREAARALSLEDLSSHYTRGGAFFKEAFVPHLKRTLQFLSGGAWQLDDFVGFAAGSDVDLMTHLVEAVAARGEVSLYPGDWFGFRVGCTQTDRVGWRAEGGGELACLCIPSVRNGHFTVEMEAFLGSADACLLNLNLFPTLPAAERNDVAQRLNPLLGKAVLSISFSRGFGLTASQLGVFLVQRDHPFVSQYRTQWEWFTNFYNAIAARAFMSLDLRALQAEDQQRRTWVDAWLSGRGLPSVTSGSYYVKAFRPTGVLPSYFAPLSREGIVRLCLKPESPR